jgi:hypothetical protein
MSISIRDGNWSDPAIWDVAPTKDSDVIVANSVTVDSLSQAKTCVVKDGASLVVSGTIELWGSLTNYGPLTGSVGKIMFHVPDDRLFTGNGTPGPDPTMLDYHPADIGLWGRGEVQISAPTVTPWLDAAPGTTSSPLAYGTSLVSCIVGNSVTLSAVPNGWQVGDSLAMHTIDGAYQVATLTAINGDNVQFTPSFTAPALMIPDGTGTRYILPKVANLSRRFVIGSADVNEGDTHHRAHVAMMMGGCAELDFVEFRNLGPRGKLGRYPVHFHKMGNSACCRLNGCSIWQSVSEPGNRFVSVHSSSQIQITSNVGLRAQGSAYFSEAGDELNNTWVGNLSIDVRSPEELTVANSPLIPNLAAGSGAQSKSPAHHFWMYNGSTVSGNVAVGPKTVPNSPLLSPDMATMGLVLLNSTVKGVKLPDPVIQDCEFFGSGDYAAWSFVQNTNYLNPVAAYCGAQFNHDAGGSPPLTFSITNPKFAFNGVGGVSPYRCQIFFNSGIPWPHTATVTGGVLVGQILLHLHYHAIVNFSGVCFRGANLVSPSYWQCMALMTNCTFACDNLEFLQNYLNHQCEPGLLRVVNGTGKIGLTTLNNSNADFSGAFFIRYPGFSGASEPNTGIRLPSPAPQTGYVMRPPTGLKTENPVDWIVDPAGTKTPTITRIGDKQSLTLPQWQASNAAGTNGYPYGFPPGVYDVRIKQADGSFKVYPGIVINSGQITQMPTLPAGA